jgi:uncharacterized protein (TIGR03437 family)
VPDDSSRHVPDLSVNASPDHDGYYVFSGGGVSYLGGTSVGAPIIAGVTALLNQYLVSGGIQNQPGLGNINPTLYRLAQSTTGIFHDVTAGNNVVPCVSGSPNCSNGSLGFSAGTGYDQVTGLGSIDAFNLVHRWSNKPPLSSAVVPFIDQNPVFQRPQPDANGNSWTFSIKLSEEAGIGTTLTDFTIDGTSEASQIVRLFGTATVPPHGSISAALGLKNLAVPKTVVFGFAGVDAGGLQWTTQLSVPFDGSQVPLAVNGVSNSASGQQVYAPGMLMSVYGTQLGTFAQSAGAIPLPQYLAGFEATINGVSAPLYYVSPGQVNLQIPYETQPGTATLAVGNPDQNASYTFLVAASAPAIFILPDGSINPSNSAGRGQIATMFITGEGQVRPALATGTTPSPRTRLSDLPQPQLPVTVTVGSMPATIQFIGIPSGLVGVTQINFAVPESAPLGTQPVVVTVGTAASPPANLTVTP